MMGLRYLRDVVTLELNEAVCTGCGMCLQVCPHRVFALEDRKARLVDRDACMECGACQRNCPTEALSVRAGVGCAAGIIYGTLKGTEPTCGCDGPGQSACC
jgi:NAD-dependent dihydropyrimidine dehydrogenase PreA subunit